VLGRLVVPGKHHIPMLANHSRGDLGCRSLGTALARAMGIPTATEGIDWLELLVHSWWPLSVSRRGRCVGR